MRALSAFELLQVWEAGRSRSMLDRAVMLLMAALAEPPVVSLAEPPVVSLAEPRGQQINKLALGRKDALLLQLREQLFGPRMESVATCPGCGEALEFSLTGRDLGAYDLPPPLESIEVAGNGYALTVRVPTIADVRAAEGAGHQLFDRVVVRATHNDEPIVVEALPDTIKAEVVERLQAADPLADIWLNLSCPACSDTWQSPLDVTSFLWREIDHWAQQMLYTVHRLASAYGWREQDILNMSAWRRQYYMELQSG